MKYKLGFIPILIALTIVPKIAKAYDYDFSAISPSGHTLYYNIVATGVEVTYPNFFSNWAGSNYYYNFTKPSGMLIIPDTVNFNNTTYDVVGIRDHAFYECSELTGITIPQYVQYVGNWAFGSCTNISYTNFTGTIEQWCAIQFASSLSSTIYYSRNLHFNGIEIDTLVIPGSMDSICNFAFSYCNSINHLEILDSVKNIGYWAFAYCANLKDVVLPNTLTAIEGIAFAYCDSLETINIPSTVSHIGIGTFEECKKLESITIPNSIDTIHENTFSGCKSLSCVSGGDNLKMIGQNAFKQCTNLRSITIPRQVSHIYSSAFKECDSLATIFYNADSCVYMGAYYYWDFSDAAFYGCNHVKTVIIGRDVKYIHHNAFCGIENIECDCQPVFHCLAEVPPILNENSTCVSDTVHIPCGTISIYESQWGNEITFLEPIADIDFNVYTSDSTKGLVNIVLQGDSDVYCDSTVIIEAVPVDGYRFDHWSNGSISNPDTLHLIGDSSVTAIFVENGTESIDDSVKEDVTVYSLWNRIIIEGVTDEIIRIFDATGRCVAVGDAAGRVSTEGGGCVVVDVPTSGTYIVKIGDHPAKKIMVIR